MAFAVRVQGIPRDHEQPVWSMEPNWWEAAELRKDPRFRQASEDAGYLDYVAVLNLAEARDLAKHFASRALSPFEKHVANLDELLQRGPPQTCWILVNVFEWESGLG